MNIKLSDHFSYAKLIKFTIPSIFMMIFTSIYGVVDGYFVSNFVGKTPFAAVNLIMPFLMMLGTVGFMIGTGGSALVSKTYGEGDKEKAIKLFSLFVYTSIIIGVTFTVVAFIFLKPIAIFLGAEGEMLEQCLLYGRISLISMPAFILQLEFQSFFVTAEKPQLGLFVTVAAGVTNMVLDFLFIAVFNWGIVGAATATATSEFTAAIFAIVYFSRKNSSILRFTKTSVDFKALLKACTNGSSELMSNLSMSLVNMLYNLQLMKYVGEDGIAAYGVLMYVNLVFLAAFIGYSIGTAPVISYHYGAENHNELKNLLKKSYVIIGGFSFSMFLAAKILSSPLAKLFTGYDLELYNLTLKAFSIFAFSFLFAGIAIFGSSFFTALNNGLVSALISFLRTLVFQTAAILLLPLIFDVDGIWMSIVIAELMAFIVTFIFIFAKKKQYKY